MHTQESNDEQSLNQVHSKVMGKSNSVQTDLSSRKPAESLSMTDLQVNSGDQQLQQEKKHRSSASLDRALARIQVLEDQQRESEKQSLVKLESNLAPAISRIEKLEQQQNAFDNSSIQNAASRSRVGDDTVSSLAQQATDNSLQKVAGQLEKMTEMQALLLEHHVMNIQQYSQDAAGHGIKKHSHATKFSRDSKFFKESWICKLLFDPDAQDYEDWRILLKNELSGVRANSIYWKPAVGKN